MNFAKDLMQGGSPDKTALITDEGVSTYLELGKFSAILAHELRAQGIRRSDRVAILGPNSLFWVAAYLGTIQLGAVAVPFSTSLKSGDLTTIATAVGCRAVCAETRYLRLASGLPPSIVRISEATIRSNTADSEGTCLFEEMDGSEDAALMFTSGSTALPKAVRITHRNLQVNTASIVAALGLTMNERQLVILPFHYCFGASLLHTHLSVGGSLVLSNSFAFPEKVLDSLQLAHCTGFAGVPSVFGTLLRNTTFPSRRFPSLRKVQQAGGALAPVLIEEMRAALPDCDIYIMYGQTEATARLSCLPPETIGSRPGSIGKAIPGVGLRVLNEFGAEVAPGEVGEIVAHGDNISPGYLDDPEATASKFVSGGLRTGDLATVDSDGYIYLTGRRSDFIKAGGHRVSCQHIEACACEIPDVVCAAAIGQRDLLHGEVVHLYVELREGSALSTDEIVRHCKRRLPSYAVPRRIEVVDALPKNAFKVQKAALRQASSWGADTEAG